MLLIFTNIEMDDAKINQLYNNHLIEYERLKVFFFLKQALAPVIEGLIIMDRLLYLYEQTKRHIILQPNNEAKHKNKNESLIKQENLNSKDIYEQKNSENQEQESTIERDNLNGKLNPEQENSEDPEQKSSIEQENLNSELNPEQKNSENLEQGSSIEQDNLTDKFNQNLENVSEIKNLGTAVSNLRTKRHILQDTNEEKQKKKKELSIKHENLISKPNHEQKNSEDPGQEISEDPQQGSSIEQESSENLEKIRDIIGITVPNLSVNEALQNTWKLCSHANVRSHLNSEIIEKVSEINNFGTAVSNLRTKRDILQDTNKEKQKMKKELSMKHENLMSKPNHEQKNSDDPEQRLSIEQENLNGKLNPEQENSEDQEQGSSIEQENLNGKFNPIQENSVNLAKIIEIKDPDTAVSNPSVNNTLKNTRKLPRHSNQRSNVKSENVEKVSEIKNLGTAVSNLCTKRHILQDTNEEQQKKKKESPIEHENLISKPNHEQKTSEDPGQEISEDPQQGSSIEQESSENLEKIRDIIGITVPNLSVNEALQNTWKLCSHANVRSHLNSEIIEKVSEINFGTAVSNLRTKRDILQDTNKEKQKMKKELSMKHENLMSKPNHEQKNSDDPEQRLSIEQENLNGKLNPEQENSEDQEQGSSIEQENLNGKFNPIQENSVNLAKIIEIKDPDTAVSNPSVNNTLKNTRKLPRHSNQRSNVKSENVEKVSEIKNLGTAVSNLCTKRHILQDTNEEQQKKKKESPIEHENLISKPNHEQKTSDDPEQGSSIERENLNGKFNLIQENSVNLAKIIEIKDIDTAVSNLSVNDTLKNTRKLYSRSNRISNLNSKNVEKVNEINDFDIVVSNLIVNDTLNNTRKLRSRSNRISNLNSENVEIFSEIKDLDTAVSNLIVNDTLNNTRKLRSRSNRRSNLNSENVEKVSEIKDLDTAVSNLSVNDTLKNTLKLRSRSNRKSNLNSENVEKVSEITDLGTAVSNLCTKREILQANNETKHKKEKESSLEQENLNGKRNQKQENSEDLRNVSGITDLSIAVSNLGVKNTRKLRSRSNLRSNLNSKDLVKSAE